MWWIAAAIASPTLDDQVALHLRLDGVVVDRASLARGYQAACSDTPSAPGCDWAGFDRAGHVDRAALAEVVRGPCDADAPAACLYLAWATGLEPNGTSFGPGAPEADQVVARLERACEAGSERACSDLGLVVSEGKVTDADPEHAAGLHQQACDAGVVIACERLGNEARAESLGSPRFLPVAEACEAGVVDACRIRLDEDGVEGDARLALLERMCHATGDRCLDLADEKAGAPASLPQGDIAGFWVVRSGVLLRGAGGTFAPHHWVPLDSVQGVSVSVAGAREETVQLQGDFGTLSLPTAADCGSVVRAVEGITAAGLLPRAVGPHGEPATSACIADLGAGMGPPYVGGGVELTTLTDGAAAAVQEVSANLAYEGLFTCAEAASSRRAPDPLQIRVLHKGDALTKTKVLASSGNDTFDRCVSDWLVATPAPAVKKAKHVLSVSLFW